MSFCLAHQGTYDNSIFKRAIETYTKNGGAAIYANLGDMYYESKDYEKAKAAYRESLELSPSKDVNVKLCSSLVRQGRYDNMIFKRAIEACTNDAERGFFYANIGDIYFELQDYVKAEVAYHECLSQDPSYPDANYRLSLCLANQGIYDNTIFKEVLKTYTNDAEHASFYADLGYIYYKSEKYALAEAAYRECLILDPSYPDADTRLGYCLACQKKYDEFRSWYLQ